MYRRVGPVDPGMRQPEVLEGWHPRPGESFGNGKDYVKTGTDDREFCFTFAAENR